MHITMKNLILFPLVRAIGINKDDYIQKLKLFILLIVLKESAR